MNRHILKIDTHWFDRLVDGTKTAEVRKHDRDFQIGDVIAFVDDSYIEPAGLAVPLDGPRRVIEATISHILPASVFPSGLQPGYSMLSLVDFSSVFMAERGDLS